MASDLQLQDDQSAARYRRYVLFVLMLVYVFNFLDRQILSILAEDIKADLGINDASMGFLLGTSFAVFYAIFGIPLGRAADVINRKNLIAGGLALWSVMTALSAFARSFPVLAGFRMGVGVGEASASPAVYSLLYDYFPKHLRATAIAIYSSGIYIGAGLGLWIGGFILEAWSKAYPVAADAPLGLQGWHAAFLFVGLPGVLLALWVASLREPVRGSGDDIAVPAHPHPFRAVGAELLSLLPVSNLVMLHRAGGGWRAVFVNLALAGMLLLFFLLLGRWTGSWMQWITLGIGAYCAVSWAQGLSLRDPAAFTMIFRCRSLMWGSVGFAGCAFLMTGMVAWLAVFFQRVHGAPSNEVGLVLGLSYAIAGFLGVTAGGAMTDRLCQRHGGQARMWVAGGAIVAASLSMLELLAADKALAYAMSFLFNFFTAMYLSPGASNANSLVVPRMRATASAAYIVLQVFLGTSLGPYVIGQLSDVAIAAGATDAEALRGAMSYALFAVLPALAALAIAARTANEDEATCLQRAQSAGEPLL